MRDGISLRQAVIGAVVALAAIAAGLALHFRSMQAALYSAAPAPVAEVPDDPSALAAAAAAVDKARAARGEVALGFDAANRALFAEWLTDPARDVSLALDPPVARLKLAQRLDDGRWLNAELLASPYIGERGLAFRILSGRVGEVSISSTAGEWVRVRIERQLEADLARNPRTSVLFHGLRDARVTAKGLVLRF